MTDHVDTLTLELLRALRNDVQTLRTEMQGGFAELEQRMSSFESAIRACNNPSPPPSPRSTALPFN